MSAETYQAKPWLVFLPGMKYPEVDRFATYEDALSYAEDLLEERRETYGGDYVDCLVVKAVSFVHLPRSKPEVIRFPEDFK